MSSTAIIVAAGKGARMKSPTPKQFLNLCGKPMLARTLSAFNRVADIRDILLVVPPAYCDRISAMLSRAVLRKVRAIVPGGKRRVDSVARALEMVSAFGAEFVAIHDGVRPLITHRDIRRCMQAARRRGAAIAATLSTDTVKRSTIDGAIEKTIDRSRIWLVQTPQVFRADWLKKAYARRPLPEVTDDSQLLEKLGKKVYLVPVNKYNIKITEPEDMIVAEALLKNKRL
jgi:2-C-methyl-D-erythritol 4-phosphate cytidylyltransferase